MMSRLNTPMRRSDGGIDVYTGLLFVALLVLVAGIGLLAKQNRAHSTIGNQAGGFAKLID